MQIAYHDGHYEVREIGTGKTVFSTELPQELKKHLYRETIPEEVVDIVVVLWNESNDLSKVDGYLLDEGLCTQEEREIIIEALYKLG